MRPSSRGDSIVQGCGELVLWRQSVVDTQHRLAAAVGQDAAEVVVCLQVAEHPSATVQEHQQAEVVAIVRSVEPGRHAAGIEIARVMDRFRRWPLPLGADVAGLRRAARLQGRLAERGHQGEQ